MAITAGVVGGQLVPAVSALPQVPTQHRGTAGDHRPQDLGEVGGEHVGLEVGRPMGAEDIRHLQAGLPRAPLLRGARVGAHLALRPGVEPEHLQGAGCLPNQPRGHPGVLRRGLETHMAQQDLDGPDVHAILEKVRRKGVPEPMMGQALTDPRALGRLGEGLAHGVRYPLCER